MSTHTHEHMSVQAYSCEKTVQKLYNLYAQTHTHVFTHAYHFVGRKATVSVILLCSLEYAYEPMDAFFKRDLVTDFYAREAGNAGGEKRKPKPVLECAYGVLGLPKGAVAAEVGHLVIGTLALRCELFGPFYSTGVIFYMSLNSWIFGFCTYLFTYASLHVCVCKCMYTNTHNNIHIHIHTFISIQTFINIYAHAQVMESHIYMYAALQTSHTGVDSNACYITGMDVNEESPKPMDDGKWYVRCLLLHHVGLTSETMVRLPFLFLFFLFLIRFEPRIGR